MTQNLKTRAYIMVNFMELPVKRFLDPKALTFRFWGLKTSLGQFGPKVFCKRFIKLASIFKNRTSFSQELWDESSKIMKSPKIF